MKKLLFTFMLLLSIMLAGCEFETSGNGDLDGFWQLMQLDSVATGTTRDMRKSGLCWAVQMRLLYVQDGSVPKRYYRFTLGGGRLKLRPANLDEQGREDQTVLWDYRVLQLNGSRMVLEDDTLRLTFRKY